MQGYLDLLCMDGAEVSMACMCSNRSCPCCWCPDSQLDDTQSTCRYRRAKDVFAQLDAAREQSLDRAMMIVCLEGRPNLPPKL